MPETGEARVAVTPTPLVAVTWVVRGWVWELAAEGPMNASTVEVSVAETSTRAPPMPLMPVSWATALTLSSPTALRLTEPALTWEPSSMNACRRPEAVAVEDIPPKLIVLPLTRVRLGVARWVE